MEVNLLFLAGDNKTLVRHASSRSILRLMGAVGPPPVVAALLPVLTHEAHSLHTPPKKLSPYTLHPKLHPTPQILHPKPQTLKPWTPQPKH
jgi:hypothetical protein